MNERRRVPRSPAQVSRLSRMQWTAEQLEWLRKMVARDTPTKLLARKLGRSEGAIRRKAAEHRIPLRRAKVPRERLT